MADTLKLEILTPTGPVGFGPDQAEQEVEVAGVEIPGVLGELGILPGHIPIVTPVVPGVVRFRAGDESVRLAVSNGFAEVSQDGRISILTDMVQRPDEVDTTEVKKELDEVEGELKGRRDSIEGAEHVKLLRRQAWLQAQLRAAEAAAVH